MNRRRELLLLAGILLVSIALRLIFINEPLERDEGLYAYVGQQILSGNIPYRDVIDHKLPGIHLIYAGLIQLGGPSVAAIRGITAVWSAVTLVAVFVTARVMAGAVAGLFAAFVFAVTMSGPLLHGNGSNCEVFLLLPLTASTYFWLLWAQDGKKALLAVSGFCFGMALLIKQVVLPIGILLAFGTFFLFGRPRIKKSCLTDLLLFGFPVMVPLCLAIGWLAANGALNDFFYWNVTYNRWYGQQGGNWTASFMKVLPRMVEQLPLWVATFPAVVWLFNRRRLPESLLLLLLVPATLAAVLLPGHNLPHYFILLTPILSILAGIGFAYCITLPGYRRGIFSLALVGAYFLLSMSVWKYYFIYSPDDASTNKYNETTFVDAARVAAHIRQQTRLDDYIFQWGIEPEIYFLANRRASNPFMFDKFVAASPEPARALAELLLSLELHKPRYLVLQSYRAAQLPGDIPLMQLAEKDYVLENVWGGMAVYRLKSL